MRYEDASNAGAFQGSGPIANDDSDTLPAGSRQAATGNLITGEGTQYGSAGADSAVGGHVTSIGGKGGEDSSFAGGKLSVSGEFGNLSVDAQGNYNYLANKGAPENVRDRFTYTLADSQGNTDTAALVVELGKTPVVIKADAQQVVVGPDGVVTLPAGVELSDIMVVGRNLVVTLPDGSQMIIVDGAVFVPQLVLGGVEVPATNVAALLIGQEPHPAAGELPPSSGGNFALPPPPLDPGVPLGDLIPPLERAYIPPEPQEVFFTEDNEPEIFVQPDGQPATVSAVDEVREDGLPTRNGGEPAGSAEIADGIGGNNSATGETTTGNIVYDSPDDPNVITINDVAVTSVGQVIPGTFGNLTITSIADGQIGYSYTLTDNTSGNDTHDDFAVQLTDVDGDIASATLRIDIIDDVPTARPDTDALGVGEFIATGNVMTDAAPGDIGDGDSNAADTVGADNATLTSVSGAGGSDSTFSGGFLVVNGAHGQLTIDAQGNYTYVRGPNSPGGVTDVFNYTLTDGDGDTSTTTLTITIPETPISITFGGAATLDDDALAGGNPGGVGDDNPDTSNTEGVVSFGGGDGGLTFSLQTSGAPDGFTYELLDGDLLIKQGGVTVITVTLDATTGEYTISHNAPIDHPAGNDENNVVFPVTVRATDIDGDFADATGQIIVDDDTPIAVQAQVTGIVDEDGVPGGLAGGNGDVTGESTVASGSVATLFSAGADAPLTYNLLSDTSGLPALTSGGVAVTYAVAGNTLTASAGGNTVFTFVLNGDGSWTFTLVDQVDHPTLDGLPGDNTENDLTVALGSIIQATDADGDPVTANANGLVITIDDDTPTANAIEATQASEDANVIVNIVGSIAGGADGVDLADVTFSAHSGSGTLSYDNGVFTYDPAPGEDGDVTFSYTIIDGDGDEVTQEVTIHLGDDSVPQIGTPENLEVDEDGFAFANVDASPLQSNPTETDHGENLTDSGNVVVDFGNDVPSAPLVDSIDLLDSGGLDGQLVDLDGNPVTFALNGSGQLVGTANGVTVMIISISGAVAGPGAGEVTYTYSAQLLQPVQHADVGNTENSDLLSGIQFQVTDSDGDPATGSFNVTVWDDVPSAQDIEVIQPAEDANVVIDITGSIVEGADGVDLADVTFSAHNGSGTLNYNDNGVFTYDPAPGEAGDVSFTYTIVDGDGDEITKLVTIHLLSDSAPIAGSSTALLDDDGLAGGNPASTTGDIDANVGEVPTVNSSEAIFHGDLNFSFGTDGAGSINFAAMDGLNGTVGTETVVYNWDQASLKLTATTVGGTRPGTLLFTLELDDATSGEYTLTLNDNVLHATGGNETSAPNVALTFTVLDSDGTDANGTLNITFNDDAPTASAAQVTGDVDEDDVPGGIDGGPGDATLPNPENVDTGSVTTLFNSGADTPLSYSLLTGTGGLPALTSGGVAVTYAVVGNTLTASAGGNPVFTFVLQSNGNWTFTLLDQLDHATLNTLAGDNTENELTINLSSIVQATDADGDSVTAGANGLIITVDDDTPTASAVQLTGTVDEDGVVENIAPGVQKGDGIAGGTDDVASEVTVATGFVTTLFNSGADAPLTYSLLTSTSGLPALTSGGVTVTYAVVGNLLTASAGGQTVFTFTVNASTGAYEFTLVDQIDHPTLNGLTGDDTENDLTINLSSIIQATDRDGDSVAAGANGLIITVDDDSPKINNVVTPLEIDNDDAPSGTAAFDFDIGADENSDNDDIAVTNFTVLVNGDPVTESLVPVSETATTASYTFSFEYDTGTGGTATANGTLVFDKVAGTYTVELTNGPIEGFGILATGSADASDFVSYQVPDGGSGAPEVTVAALDTDFFVQFSGVAEPSSGTGANNLVTTQGAAGAFSPVTTTNFDNLELFTQAMSTVQVSSTAAGVAGNTIQGGEVLDFNLYNTDPAGTLGGEPTASSTSMFVVLDGIGGSEDMIVVLKLYDTVTGQYTTKAMMVQNADIITSNATLAGTAYEGIVLDNNDGIVIFEANDYQAGNTNLVIVGAQIAGSDEDITGDATNLNGALGAGGGSVGTQTFATDVSDAPFKITSIGFLTTSTEDQNAQIDFDVTIEDFDGDKVVQHITVNIGDTSGTLAATSFMAQEEQLQKTAANSNTLTMAAAVAAAGVADSAAASQPESNDSDLGGGDELVASYSATTVEKISVDDGADSSSLSMLSNDASSEDSAPAQSSSSSSSDQSASSQGLGDGPAPAASEASDHSSVAAEAPTHAADASPIAPTVAMVSAEAIEAAASVADNAQKGGSVEQIVAEALSHGDAPSVDGLLAHLPGGNGELPALAQMASPDSAAVSGWDMAGHGAIGAGFDVMFKADVAMHHQDAVQPTANG